MSLNSLSSLNMFYASEDGERVLISTASSDILGPIFAFDVRYPKQRTSRYYSVSACQHKWEHYSTIQLRRGDEAPTVLYQCILCKKLKH
ncbi:lef-5 [Fopius arisanus]|nr:lef-5 [Fopius arisanus]